MNTTIKVFDVIGKNAISMQSGDKIYLLLKQNMKENHKVILDFSGVSLFATPFFNTAIGYLLKDMEIKALQEQLDFIHLDEVGNELLNLVIFNAINYYRKS